METYFKQFIKIYLTIGILLISSCTNEVKDKELNVDAIVDSLTLEQKAMLVVGTGMSFEMPDSIINEIFGDGPNPLSKTLSEDSSYNKMVDKLKNVVPGSAGRTAIIPKYGITTMVLADGPAGLRILPKRENDTNSYYATAFPIATALASTWNTDLIKEVGKAMGNEVLEYGVDVLLGPGMNLQRNPLCGRNFEYYSEDPLVTGKMAAAMINGIQSNGVGTSAKHYAANNQETNRLTVNTVVSERALRELYLKGFRIAVQEAQPWTVMSSYNLINEVYASESYDLLTKVLRDEWGFKGYVMTDWTAGNNPIEQMKAGNDLLMPGDPKQMEDIIESVKNNSLDEKILDRNIKSLLKIMAKTPTNNGYKASNKPNLNKSAEVARKAGGEGMVLLKNLDNTLPINNTKTIAVFGIGSYSTVTGGTGSGDVNEAYTVSIIEGLKKANYKIVKTLEETYLNYLEKNKVPDLGLVSIFKGTPIVPEMRVSTNLINNVVNEAEIALITLKRNSGEGKDRKPEAGDFDLTESEKSNISNISDTFHKNGKKVVVVLNIGGVIETSSWSDTPDAILIAWQPGQEAGNALADVLSGKINPSGKLAVSFPKSYTDVPSSSTFPGHKIDKYDFELKPEDNHPFFPKEPWETIYEDDIYVGYRYYNTFNVPVAYEFGYGLSYTRFEFSNLSTNSEVFNDVLEVQVNIKNSGDFPGKDVAQLYISAPQGKLEKPVSELRGFKKTNILEPGESQTLRMKLAPMDLASFDESTSSWIIEPGEYEIKIGASSIDIKQKVKFIVQNEIIVQKMSKALSPKVEFKKISRNESQNKKAVGF